MNNQLKQTLEYLKTIKEAPDIFDKLAIIRYIIRFATYSLFSVPKDKRDYSLGREITLEHSGIKINTGTGIAGFDMGRKYFEKDLIRYFDIEDGTFIDIGANIGRYSLIIGNRLRNKGSVLAIEAEPKNFTLLRENIRLNNLRQTIKAINVGAWDKIQIEKINVEDHNHFSGTSSMIIQRAHSYEQYLPCFTLDKIVADLNIQNIKLIKIDVEGAELKVLEGAIITILTNRPKILFEAWNLTYLAKITTLLDQLNYTYKQIDEEYYLAEPKEVKR